MNELKAVRLNSVKMFQTSKEEVCAKALSFRTIQNERSQSIAIKHRKVFP